MLRSNFKDLDSDIIRRIYVDAMAGMKSSAFSSPVNLVCNYIHAYFLSLSTVQWKTFHAFPPAHAHAL